ncbi:MAG: Polysaccharide biosynthesis protein [uncultured bacterium]|nr:MAG: Polysaccharide biosynthesis protein [uncultured bacterium]
MNIISIFKNLIRNPHNIFFKNVSLRQTVAKNTFWLGISEVINGILKIVLFIYIARILGVEEYGKFSFAVSFVTIFIYIADFGLSQIITRDFSANSDNDNKFNYFISLKIILNTISFICLFIGSFFITNSYGTQHILQLIGMYLVLANFIEIFTSFLRAKQKMELETLIKIIQSIIIVFSGIITLKFYPTLLNLSIALSLSSLVSIIFSFIYFSKKIQHFKIAINMTIWKNIIIASFPLALSGLFWTFYTQIDTIIMGHLNLNSQVGWYNASNKIIGILLISSRLIIGSFYPVMCQYYQKSQEMMQKTWNYLCEVIISLSVPTLFGSILLSDKIINLIYGANYQESIKIFQILIITTTISFITIPLTQLLIVANKQKYYLYATFWATVVNLILNLILIPKYGMYGASYTSIITILTVLIINILNVKRFINLQITNTKILFTLLIALISSLFMYLIISLLISIKVNLFLIIPISVLIYGIVYITLRQKIFIFRRINDSSI